MKTRATAALIVQVALAMALLLVGWGLDDWRGFFAEAARTAFVAVALLGVATALVLRLDLKMFRKGRQDVGRQRWILPGLMLVALFLVWFLPYADRRGVLAFTGAGGLRWLGVGLYAAGALIVLAALKTLGKQYSGYVTLQDDHQLVQRGIYGVIRHPIYLRALLVSVGLPLVFRSWLVVPLMALVSVFVAWRIRQEEKLLAEHFGAEFESYRRRTWRLIPYLY